MIRISSLTAAVAVSAALGLAALELDAIAQADTGRPGEHLFAGIPSWEVNMCHGYYWPHEYGMNAPTLFIDGPLPEASAPGFRGREVFAGIRLPC